MASVNGTLSNWEPGGNFINKDYIFAMGAVNQGCGPGTSEPVADFLENSFKLAEKKLETSSMVTSFN